MKSQTLVAVLLLGLVVVVHSSPAKLDEIYEQRESKSNLSDDDDDDDDDKRPYSFAYEASRHYHGAPDREHREERGEDGITRGVYRYVDPSLRVQEVIYTADENGFHVQSNNEPEYTEAQIAARERHAQLFAQIADEHNRIGNEHALKAAERGYEPQPYVAPQSNLDYSTGQLDPASLPQFSPVVERARTRHQELFAKIAAQHARIAAERKTDPRAEETGEPYEYQYDTPLKTVEVVSGSAGPSVLSRSASVVAPGEGHPDFQGYGVPLGTFRDDLTEEEALALLEEENQRHLMRHMEEANNHERLVLGFMPSGAPGPRQNRPGGNRALTRGSSGANQGSRTKIQGSGHGIRTGTGGSDNRGQGGAGGKVQTSFSHNTPNAHSNVQGQSRFSAGNVDQFRSDSHNQRAIGGAGVKFNDNAQFSSSGPEAISYSAGGAGSQAQGNAGGQTQHSIASAGSGHGNSNTYSSGQGSSGALGSGSHGVGGSGSQGHFSAKPQGNAGSSQGQYSGVNQASGGSAQFSAGNKHTSNQGQSSGGNKQNRHGSNKFGSGATGQNVGQYAGGNQGTSSQASLPTGNQHQQKNQRQHNAAGAQTQHGGQASFSAGNQQQGKRPGNFGGAGAQTQHVASFSAEAHQQGKKQGTFGEAGAQTQHGASYSAGNNPQAKKQGNFGGAGAQTQHGGQAAYSGNQQQGKKQGNFGGAGAQTQHGASYSGNQQQGKKQGNFGGAGVQTQHGASYSGNQQQGKKQGNFGGAGAQTQHAASYSGNQQQEKKQGNFGGAGAQTHHGSHASFSAGNQERQKKQGQSYGAGGNHGNLGAGAGQTSVGAGRYQAGQQGHHGSGSHSFSSSGSFHGSQGQQQGTGLQTLAGGDYSADHEQARALLEEQRQEHLRQFRKIAQAHEQIGDEHHQLTLATLQKHKMKIQNW